jgi:hypothetical protein
VTLLIRGKTSGMHDWNRLARLKGETCVRCSDRRRHRHREVAILNPRPNRIVTEAAGPYTVACDVNGSSGARGQAHDTADATPTRTDQRRWKLDIFHIIGAR